MHHVVKLYAFRKQPNYERIIFNTVLNESPFLQSIGVMVGSTLIRRGYYRYVRSPETDAPH